jgi:CubicO group peptidase (beta-lactamase class C family)
MTRPISLAAALLISIFASAQPPQLDKAKLVEADRAIDAAIAAGKCPGAVLCVGNSDGILYLKAYGNKSLKPTTQPMTTDTVFDLASLSKSVGCASSAIVLIDRHQLDPAEKLITYLPAFNNHGKDVITVEQLMLHHAGFMPDDPIKDYDHGPAAAIEAIANISLDWPPGTHFKYSDVSFITLGKVVESVAKEPLDSFAHKNVFEPLGMKETTYNPPESLRARCAPTQERDGHWMIGEVHDPRACALGGVAGHAGLFSTATDLSRWCRMILHHGELDGHRIMSDATVAVWTEPHSFPDGSGGTAVRAYGFDVDTPYSQPRGDRFTRGVSFGHTGFTGTSFWIDPPHNCFIILLTNSVHPAGKGNVLALRRQVSNLVAESLGIPAPAKEPAH